MRHFEYVKNSAKDFPLPERKTEFSSGYDFVSPEKFTISALSFAKVALGVKVYMQKDEYLALHIRSSIAAKKHLILTNSVGVIDADYVDNPENEGEIGLLLYNPTNEYVTIEKGERIAQGIISKYYTVDEEELPQEERKGGFGSTGTK